MGAIRLRATGNVRLWRLWRYHGRRSLWLPASLLWLFWRTGRGRCGVRGPDLLAFVRIAHDRRPVIGTGPPSRARRHWPLSFGRGLSRARFRRRYSPSRHRSASAWSQCRRATLRWLRARRSCGPEFPERLERKIHATYLSSFESGEGRAPDHAGATAAARRGRPPTRLIARIADRSHPAVFGARGSGRDRVARPRALEG